MRSSLWVGRDEEPVPGPSQRAAPSSSTTTSSSWWGLTPSRLYNQLSKGVPGTKLICVNFLITVVSLFIWLGTFTQYMIPYFTTIPCWIVARFPLYWRYGIGQLSSDYTMDFDIEFWVVRVWASMHWGQCNEVLQLAITLCPCDCCDRCPVVVCRFLLPAVSFLLICCCFVLGLAWPVASCVGFLGLSLEHLGFHPVVACLACCQLHCSRQSMLGSRLAACLAGRADCCVYLRCMTWSAPPTKLIPFFMFVLSCTVFWGTGLTDWMTGSALSTFFKVCS